jgi:hypothetical protein
MIRPLIYFLAARLAILAHILVATLEYVHFIECEGNFVITNYLYVPSK